MSKELTELRNFKVKEVSVVDKGANKKKRFPIFKQESNKMNEEIIKAVLETEVEGEANLQEFIDKSELDEGGIDAVKGALRILSSFKDKLPQDTISKLAEVAGYDKPVIKQAKEEKPPVKEKQKEEEEEEEEMSKSLEGLPEEVKKQFEEIQKAQEEKDKKIEALEKSLKAEKDRRELEEWVSKAREELDGIPGKTSEELGKELKALADANKELADSQFETLKKSSEAIKEGNLFKELGGRGIDVAGSAMDRLNKIAAGYVEKAAGEMTKEQAFQKALEDNPTLYAQYMTEHPQQQGRN